MRKGLIFSLFLITLVSCSQDIVFNNDAAFQGLMDNVLWKATDATATINTNNSLSVKGVAYFEALTLKIPLPKKFVKQKNAKSYLVCPLGVNETSKAGYTKVLNGVNYTYQTGDDLGDGEIIITDYDGETVSGTFRFNAVNADPDSDAVENVNFNEGNFYKVPIVP